MTHLGTQLNEVLSEVKDIKLKVSEPTLRSHSDEAFQIVFPPPPTEFFTGRDEYLKQMECYFELPMTSMELQRQRKLVLHGTGGMGKKQLALKLLKQNRTRFIELNPYFLITENSYTLPDLLFYT